MIENPSQFIKALIILVLLLKETSMSLPSNYEFHSVWMCIKLLFIHLDKRGKSAGSDCSTFCIVDMEKTKISIRNNNAYKDFIKNTKSI
jgi:hypothetical protein